MKKKTKLRPVRNICAGEISSRDTSKGLRGLQEKFGK